MFSILLLKLTNFAVVFGDKCDPNKANPNNAFLSFPHWWKYISNGTGDTVGNCTPAVHFPDGLLPIGLAIIDMLLYFAGLAAVISIIIAGISYILAAGSADKVTASRKRIVNSLLGLAVVIIATGTVSFIGNHIK